MNSTKNNLIKASAIFAIISGISSILSGVIELCDLGYVGETLTGYGMFDGEMLRAAVIIISVFEILLGACSLIGGVLLLRMTKAKNSRRTYKAGCTLVILGGLGIGFQSILLYIAFATNSQIGAAEHQNDYVNNNTSSYTTHTSNDNGIVERQIQLLRQMRDRGEINDEEFKKMMFDLIKNQK